MEKLGKFLVALFIGFIIYCFGYGHGQASVYMKLRDDHSYMKNVIMGEDD